MIAIRTWVVVGLLAAFFSAPAIAQVAECDRLAASPADQTRPSNVPGVAFDKVNAALAVRACTRALTEQPSDARIKYQLARAMTKAGAPPERYSALLLEAADHGNLAAAHNLANMYEDGTGVPQDQAEAVRLWRKAAEGGVMLSMGPLARHLFIGNGVGQNATEGLLWFRKAAAAGDSEAERFLAGRIDLDVMPAAEIQALQQRLTDAKCYSGPIDGQASDAAKNAVAACPDQRPILRIETAMHVAPVKHIDVDAQCRLAATVSDDKTLRLWSLPEGRSLRILRVPIAGADGGKLRATAVSPDGRFVAAGGWDARWDTARSNSVYIFDSASGALVARAGAFGNTILDLVFSPDGRWLAATLDSKGVRMIDAASWREVSADTAYGDDSYGAAFAPDGRLYTVALDGKIRRYAPGPGFHKEAEIVARGGKKPLSIAVDPRGSRIAVGFGDTTTVDLYDAPSLAFHAAADTIGIANGDLNAVAWRGDGERIIAGGKYYEGAKSPVVLFDRDGRRTAERPAAISKNTILNIRPCGSGFVVASFDPAIGILNAAAQTQVWRPGASANMRGKVNGAFMISADAKIVRFGLDYAEKQPVTFDLRKAALGDAASSGLTTPRVTGLPIANWLNAPNPTFADRPIALDEHETSRSVAIRADRSGLALGTSFKLRSFDAKGALRWERPAPSDADGVNLSADGRIIVVAYSDGTIRWHRWSDGAELLALFVNANNKTWVAWTPSGYYSASPGGEDMIGWHLNRGWDQAADFFPASKFRDVYSRADIVERVLDTLDEGEAVKQANAARPGKILEAGNVAEHLPPVLSILTPVDGAKVGGAQVQIDYLVRSPSGLPVDGVEALIDGRPAGGSRGLRAAETEIKECLTSTRGFGRLTAGLQGCRGSISVSLPPGISEIGLFARAGNRTSEVVKVRLSRTEAATPIEASKPKLYALVVGVSAYANKDYTLQFAAKDARDFATALQNQKGGLYGDVEIRSLTDERASSRAIREGLDWLIKSVTSRDVGLVYLAGHGMLDERDRFYFLAADSDATQLRASAIPRDDISDALDALSGKALLFLDACHAGAVADNSRRGVLNINAVVNDIGLSERGVVVFAASTGRQVSQENIAWNNGAFTKAVVEGLGLPGSKARADLLGDSKITASELDAYVTQRVKTLTDGAQSPVMIRPNTVPDFTLAMQR